MDKYSGFSNLTSQAERWMPTPAWGVLAEKPKGVYCNSAGTLSLMGNDGVTVTFNVVTSQTLDVRPAQVVQAGTSLPLADIILLLD